MSKRFLKSLAIILLIFTILAPSVTYSYFTSIYTNKERSLEQQMDSQIDRLQSNINTLNEENSQLTNLTQPYLITDLGWYLHTSNDPVPSSKDTLTVYGTIYNIGALPAYNAELFVKFYGYPSTLPELIITLLQTSNISLGGIPSTNNFGAPFNIGSHDITCLSADHVTNVTISISPI